MSALVTRKARNIKTSISPSGLTGRIPQRGILSWEEKRAVSEFPGGSGPLIFSNTGILKAQFFQGTGRPGVPCEEKPPAEEKPCERLKGCHKTTRVVESF